MRRGPGLRLANPGCQEKHRRLFLLITEKGIYTMTINDWIHVIAGIFIIAGIVLGSWLNPLWYLFTAFVGLNLLQYGFTRFCPMALVLKRLGVQQ